MLECRCYFYSLVFVRDLPPDTKLDACQANGLVYPPDTVAGCTSSWQRGTAAISYLLPDNDLTVAIAIMFYKYPKLHASLSVHFAVYGSICSF